MTLMLFAAMAMQAASTTALASTPQVDQPGQVAPPAQIVHAQLQTRTITQPLAREVDALAARGQPAWLGYRVPMSAGRRMCSDEFTLASPVLLEPPQAMTVLVRVEAGAVVKIRTVTPDCAVDAGGLPFIWLDGVHADDSAGWLASLIPVPSASVRTAAVRRGIVDQALAALAFHDGEPATRTLVSTARGDSRPEVRGRALFWLGQRAGNLAVPTISTAVDSDPDLEVKTKAVFALSQLPAGAGVPKLIDIARTHREPQVRRQAMFWLGQSRDPRAVSFFEEILREK